MFNKQIKLDFTGLLQICVLLSSTLCDKLTVTGWGFFSVQLVCSVCPDLHDNLLWLPPSRQTLFTLLYYHHSLCDCKGTPNRIFVHFLFEKLQVSPPKNTQFLTFKSPCLFNVAIYFCRDSASNVSNQWPNLDAKTFLRCLPLAIYGRLRVYRGGSTNCVTFPVHFAWVVAFRQTYVHFFVEILNNVWHFLCCCTCHSSSWSCDIFLVVNLQSSGHVCACLRAAVSSGSDCIQLRL